MPLLSKNDAYVATRAKSRKKSLIDGTRMRQLLQQTPEQLSISIADSGYRNEIDLYASGFQGSDLVEAALTHNLENELSNILNLCSGRIREQVEVYTGRFRYHNAKVVLRSIFNKVDVSEINHTVLPEENEINVPWLKIVEESDTMRSAVEKMRRLPFGKELMSLPEGASLKEYEDVLDRHYFSDSLSRLKGTSAKDKVLRNVISTEIDHRNIINFLEAEAFSMEKEQIETLMIPGGSVLKTSKMKAIVSGGRPALMDALRRHHRFDAESFESAVKESEDKMTLDPVVVWLKNREVEQMKRLGYLHPVSAIPIVSYVAAKVKEVQNLRFIVRGSAAGLSAEILEAHVL